MSHQENIKDKILNYMGASDQSRFQMNDLSHGLNMSSADEFKQVVKAVAELERDGDIILSDHGDFMLPKEDGLIEGIFRKNKKGFGFVGIEDWEDDVFIPIHRTNHAMDRDRVLISIEKNSKPKEDKGPEGTVQKILEHGTTHAIAEFTAYSKQEADQGAYYGYAQPQDKKLDGYTIFIQKNGIQPKEGSVVLVEIVNYPDAEHESSMTGVVTTEIGGKNEPGVDILSVVYKHGIPTEFSEATLQEVEDVPDVVLEEEKVGRLDLRGLPTVTIDGADAKDLDDAISLEKLDNGNFKLGVHIADVSHYVQANSAIDEDAFERGTSSYLTDRVIPMLPQKLSNGICSLHPNVDRLAMTCFMEIDHRGKVVDYQITPSLIKSDQRMTYDQVNGILQEGDPQLYKEFDGYITLFEDMRDLHNILERKRYNRGAINFDTEEAEVEVDDLGKPVAIHMRERGVGERMIESFMLQANETVSEHYTKKKLPILYRVHERPDEAKMQSFIEFAAMMGISIKGTKDTVKPKQLQDILEKVDGKDEDLVVSMTLLRSMQQARYDVEPLGHFGLASEFYSHFTSPIRRYPDLILHRLIHLYEDQGASQGEIAQLKKDLPEIAEQSSITERRAVDAEREVDNMKKVEYMADQVGKEFEAVIVSVLSFGMFVQLDNTVEGLVHVSTMKQDYFEYNEAGKMLIGQRTGVRYRMGEKVPVRLVEANTETYELDFELVVDEEDQQDQGQKGSKHQDQRQKSGNGKNKRNRRGRRRADKKQGQQGQKNAPSGQQPKQPKPQSSGPKKGPKPNQAKPAKKSGKAGQKKKRHFKITKKNK